MADPQALLQKAQKEFDGASKGWGIFGNKESKYLNAAEGFGQAANAFRSQKQFVKAGEAFEFSADVHERYLNEPDDAANQRAEAFKMYCNDPTTYEKAATCLDRVIKQYCSRGNWRRAAGQQEKLGDLFEQQLGDQARAKQAYETAAGWYDDDGAGAMGNKMWLKVADLAGLTGDYYGAAELFEKQAEKSLSNNLMKWSVKDYLFKAGICYLATGDLVLAQRALDKFPQLDPTFAGQKEYRLLVDLKGHMETGSLQEFTQSLFYFDQVSKLDKWKTEMFLRVKSQIKEAPVADVGGGPDGGDDEFA